MVVKEIPRLTNALRAFSNLTAPVDKQKPTTLNYAEIIQLKKQAKARKLQ